eukprot:GILJ01009551.1.p2 GENE.GILJ01009551.1~~GILJ01009551.1.p2  ORF type:complete len:108 (+),score=23.96 GILJ01009551.1:158-481(+)
MGTGKERGVVTEAEAEVWKDRKRVTAEAEAELEARVLRETKTQNVKPEAEVEVLRETGDVTAEAEAEAIPETDTVPDVSVMTVPADVTNKKTVIEDRVVKLGLVVMN